MTYASESEEGVKKGIKWKNKGKRGEPGEKLEGIKGDVVAEIIIQVKRNYICMFN